MLERQSAKYRLCGLLVVTTAVSCASAPPCVEVQPPSVHGRPTVLLSAPSEVPPVMPAFATVDFIGFSTESGCPTVTEDDVHMYARSSVDMVAGTWHFGGKTGSLSGDQRAAIAAAYGKVGFGSHGRINSASSRVRLTVVASGTTTLYEEFPNPGSPIRVDGLSLWTFHGDVREMLVPQ